MSVFDIDNEIIIDEKMLLEMDFERVTKNTWHLNTSISGYNDYRWWFLPVIITYDIKRKMFRRDKKRYFIKDKLDFEIVFKSITEDTNYRRYKL